MIEGKIEVNNKQISYIQSVTYLSELYLLTNNFHNLFTTSTPYKQFAIIDSKLVNTEIFTIKSCFTAVYILNATENNKNINTIEQICSWLIAQQADRNTLLVGIGGGITTDITGFVASVYKRGINFGFIPTTLLSQVDAGIGGKNGVNIGGFKNMIGTINQPMFIINCTEVLKTLNNNDFYDGCAELLKTFIIDNRQNIYQESINLLYKINTELKLNSSLHQIIINNIHALHSIIKQANNVKIKIVNTDAFEGNERKKLNLGHTFAHAIEWKSNGQISHGKAVAMGIILASKLSINKDIEQKLTKDFNQCGLPTMCPYSIKDLLPAMQNDKKKTDNLINFVLIKNIGEVFIQGISTNMLSTIK